MFLPVLLLATRAAAAQEDEQGATGTNPNGSLQ
jgi:hypothetical protein